MYTNLHCTMPDLWYKTLLGFHDSRDPSIDHSPITIIITNKFLKDSIFVPTITRLHLAKRRTPSTFSFPTLHTYSV